MGYHVDELEGLLHLSPGLMGGAPRRTTQRHIEGVADFMGVTPPMPSCRRMDYHNWLVVWLPSNLFSQKYWESHHPN